MKRPGRSAASRVSAITNRSSPNATPGMSRPRLDIARLARLEDEPEDTDVYVMRKKRRVAVTPLSLDLTARVDLSELEKFMRK